MSREIEPEEIEACRVVMRYGKPGPHTRRLDIQPPLTDDEDSDCWTHAWQVARALDATYVEGVCRLRGQPGVSLHAWVEAETAFGSVLIETTHGYEEALGYRGLAIDNRVGGMNDRLTGDDEQRCSILQAALAAGVETGLPFDTIVAKITSKKTVA